MCAANPATPNAWWLYFDTHEELVVRKDLGTGQRVLYGYLGIYCGLSVTFAAIGFSIGGELNTTDHIAMITAGLAMFMGSMVFIYGMTAFKTGAQRISSIILVAASGLMLVSGHLSG